MTRRAIYGSRYTCPNWMRREKADLSSGCKPHPATAPASRQCRNASFDGGGM